MNCSSRIRLKIAAVVPVFAFAGILQCQSPLARLVTAQVRNAEKYDNLRDDGTCRAKQIVRFRLEVGANESIYLLLSGPKGSAPMGFSREHDSGKILGRERASAQDFSTSPRVRMLSSQPGAQWIPLPPSAVYEWEANHCSIPGKNKSLSVFIREDMTREPIEVEGPWY